MKFVIASLPRCGSTAVYRILKSDLATRIAYEPSYFDLGADLRKIGKTTSRCFRRFDGIKHVWDPNGWPFRNPEHISTLDALERSVDLIPANRAVLAGADRVAWLRRANGFDRTLSDLWGQQTSLWGHEPDQPHDPSEAERYRAAAHRHDASALDPEVFAWYMANAGRWESSIVGGLPSSTVRTFNYEDLFGSSTSQAGTSEAWYELAEWLGLSPDFESDEVRKIMSPASKLNSADVYERIPNFRSLKASFG